MPTETERWLAETYARAPERDEPFTTISGEPVKPLYTPDDVGAIAEIGFPGEYPYTRGVHPSMYRGRQWTVRLVSGFGTAQESNERFRYLVANGQTALSAVFDMPTLMGCDSDDRRSHGEVGRGGTAIDTVADIEELFAGIPLGETSVNLVNTGPAAVLLALYVVAAERSGVPAAQLRGTIQSDVLKEYIAQKEWCFPIEPALRVVTDMIEFCEREMPAWHPISISGYHMREAGATAAQELAFTLKNGFTYVERAMQRGMAIDDFAPRLSFFFDAHIDFFEEIAKFRAARRIWARELRDTYDAASERSLLMRFHAQTAGVSLTAQHPMNNIVRTAVEALAAVLGGTQSLHTNSYDEALALPTEGAARIALATQHVLAHETGVANSIDPLGGSYFVEALTDRLEAAAYEYFEKIDALGGMVSAIELGYPQREIADASFAHHEAVATGDRRVVGVNFLTDRDEAAPIELHRVAPGLERKQVTRLQAVRARRDAGSAETALARLRAVAVSEANIMPALLDCARADCSEGEMVRALQDVLGTYTETPVF